MLALAIGALTAVVSAPAAYAATTDYRIGDTQPVDSVNPFNEQNEISYDITSLTYDLLLNYRTSDLAPDLDNSLAQSYTVSPDGKTWTFHLRSGITWSDGQPFTSADVKWTYDAARKNTSNVMNAYVADIGSVDTPDDTTVILHLTDPDVRMSSIFVPILPQHVFAKYKISQLDKIQLPLPNVTTAPYQITTYDKSGTTILTANPKFRGAAPAVKRILVTRYGNEDSLLRDLQGNKLDMVVDGNLQWAKQLSGSTDLRQWSGAAPGFQEIAFNSCPPKGSPLCSGVGGDVHVKVVQDHAIREALAYAVDRPNLAQTVYAGAPKPAYGLISPYYSEYFKDWSTDPDVGYQFNLAKAKQVLANGGWNCSSSPCTKDGVQAAFTLDVRTNDEPGQNAMRRVVAWAGQIGIKITLSVVTEDALNNKIYAPGKGDKYAPDYDAFYWAWTGDPTPDFNFSVLESGNDWSDSYYANPAYDKLVNKALATTTMSTRVDLLHQAEKIAMTDLPYIPIVYSVSYDVTRTDTWHNYQPSPAGSAGSPIGTNWLQIAQLQPGPQPASAPSTTAGGSATAAAGSGAATAGPSASGSAVTTTAAAGSTGSAVPSGSGVGAGSTASAGSGSPTGNQASSSGGVAVWVTIVIALLVGVIGFLLGRMGNRGGRRERAGGHGDDDGADDDDDAPFA